MISINKLRKRSSSTNINDVDDVYSQYVEDYQFYFDNSLNKTKYKDKYNNNVSGQCILLDVSNNNDKNGDEKWITTLPNSNIELLSVISLEFAKDLTQYWVVEDKEYLAIPSHDKFKISPLFYAGILQRYGIDDIPIDTKVVDNDAIVKEKKIYYSPKVVTIERGDYITYNDSNKTYLVTDVQNFTDLPFADSTECNHILKYIIDGKLFQMQSVVVNNPRFTLGLKVEVSGFTEGDDILRVKIPYNEDTKLISLGQRFIINGQAWKATKTDWTVNPGLLTILLGETAESTNDDLINEIADAFLHNYKISLSSNSQSILETSTYQINSIVTDDGISVSSPIITYVSSNTNIATVDNNGLVTALTVGICTITCSIGSVSTDLALNVTAKTVTPVISYGYKFSQGTSIKQYVTSVLTCTKTVDSVTTPLNISCSWDSVGQSLISSGKIVVTTKSSSSIGIKNALITSSTVAHLTVTDIDTGILILDNVAITFVNGL